MTMMISGFLALPLEAQNLTQQSYLQLLHMGKLKLKVNRKSTKMAVVGSAWGTGPAVPNGVGMLEYRFVFFCFYF